jgi:hypothetical protein
LFCACAFVLISFFSFVDWLEREIYLFIYLLWKIMNKFKKVIKGI